MKKFTQAILENNNIDDDLSILIKRIIGDCKMDYDQIEEHAPKLLRVLEK